MKKISSNIFLILLMLVSISVLNLCKLSQLEYAILMCTVFISGLGILWVQSKITPFFLFCVSFSFLFIGGRFWAFLLSPDENLFDLLGGTFLIRDGIPTKYWVNLLTWVICFYIFSILGYIFKKKMKLMMTACDRNINTILNVVFWPLTLFSVGTKLQDFHYALSNGGYLAMFEDQTQSYSSFSSLGVILLYALFGMAYTYGDKILKRKYLSLLFVYSFLTILIGSRGAFGSFMMLLLWLYSRNRKLNVIKLFVVGSSALILLLVIFSFSIRAVGVEGFTGIESLSAFFYSQGITLLVFEKTMEINSFPIVATFQSFIPGSTFFYTHFIKPSAYPYELTFDAYISYNVNPEAFMNGNGLGWSILGDFYVFSNGNVILFAVMSVLFGYICAYIENRCSTKSFFNVLVFATFIKFMFLPRAGLNTIIPFIWYIAIIYIMIRTVSLSSKARIIKTYF